ncbi:hypothetical protein B0H14DRAFT_3423100 [Mycena olivaceomarginata]|nr:hypothetical protein B0H14DRAFT_3423100 [Mycena olivaceomarginata]
MGNFPDGIRLFTLKSPDRVTFWKYAQGQPAATRQRIWRDSRQSRDIDTTGYGTGSVQLVGGEGAATRLRDEEEESQETDLDHSAPLPWTDEERRALEALFEPDYPPWLLKQKALELEATQWMAMDEGELRRGPDFGAAPFPWTDRMSTGSSMLRIV